MRRLVPGGLRGRLVLAFVITSALTLAVAVAVVLGPLREQLREQSVDNLQGAVLAARLDFETALDGDAFAIDEVGRDLRERTDARVLVGNTSLTREASPFDTSDAITTGFFSDTEIGNPSTAATLAGLRAMRLEQTVTQIEGDDVSVAVPLYRRNQGVAGVLVAQRRLTEVTIAVEQVRNALLVAAAAGMLVALGLGIALSNTLLRRLARLRSTALRISAEGPDAPAPRDEVRDEVGDLARALARMQEELRRQEAARRAFVSTASHELRTPLTMLQGTMELLEEDIRAGQIDELDALRQVSTARRELDRLSALSGELLDLSRLDAAVPLRSEPVELGEIVRAVAAEFELRAHERSTSIEVILPEASCWGRGDPDAVARVVRILLDNALRYGPRGQPVSVEAHSGAGEARITVADQGDGIPPEERDRIFERFHRGGTASSSGGFGLGLAIGRELARRMGGELEVDGDGSDGTRFALTLRTARSPADPPRDDRDRVSA
jgi:signal transduction histidine kinase